jgi:hypothetical protein
MAINLLLAGTLETPETALAWGQPASCSAGVWLLNPGRLEAYLEAMQRLIAFYLVTVRLEQRQSCHEREHHVLDEIP